MAQIVLTDVRVSIAGVDLTDHVTSVTLDLSVDEVETTAFGSTARTRVGGLLDHSVSIDFQQDYATSSVEATIRPLVLARSTAAVVLKPNGTAVTATNNSYSFSVLCTEWQSINGAVGDLATASVTWPISGNIAIGTA